MIFHAPVGFPMMLVSTAIRPLDPPWHTVEIPRYGDANVSFLAGGRNAQMGMLDGKVAIVTGAGNGVGRGEAVLLAAHGAKVVVNDLGGSVTGDGADAKVADEVVEVIKSRGGEAVANYDSVADYEGAGNIVKTAIDAFGRLDVLVNNAGILRDKMMFSMTPEDFDAVVKVHMYGSFNTMQHASAYWRNESKEGRQPERVDRQHRLVGRPAGPGEPDQLRRREGRHRRDDDHRQPRAHPLRRACQLRGPGRRHPHGRRGHGRHRDQEPRRVHGVHRR